MAWHDLGVNRHINQVNSPIKGEQDKKDCAANLLCICLASALIIKLGKASLFLYHPSNTMITHCALFTLAGIIF